MTFAFMSVYVSVNHFCDLQLFIIPPQEFENFINEFKHTDLFLWPWVSW